MTPEERVVRKWVRSKSGAWSWKVPQAGFRDGGCARDPWSGFWFGVAFTPDGQRAGYFSTLRDAKAFVEIESRGTP